MSKLPGQGPSCRVERQFQGLGFRVSDPEPSFDTRRGVNRKPTMISMSPFVDTKRRWGGVSIGMSIQVYLVNEPQVYEQPAKNLYSSKPVMPSTLEPPYTFLSPEYP